MIAYHEAGHALVAKKLPHADPVHKISIIARGMMGGYMKQLPAEDRHLYTPSHLKDILATSLGGRVAEEIIFGEVSTGAQNDLEQVTTIARKMVKEYGMSDKLPPRTFGRREELVFLGRMVDEQKDYGDKVADVIDQEIEALVNSSYNVAKDILTGNTAKLKQVAAMLIAEETIEGKSLDMLFDEPVPSTGAQVEQG
jgi:cell division protease FtsH